METPLRRPAHPSNRRQPEDLFILGLTGSIGMGKSTVASFFKKNGVQVFDADEVVHRLYQPGGAAVPLIQKAFPKAVVDGGVDRKILSSYVVGNQEAMRQLEGIVHPLVSSCRMCVLEAAYHEGQCLVLMDIPLLFETHAEQQVDAVAVVSAPADVQRDRVLRRPGMTQEKFESILQRQIPDEEKRRRADFVIDTSVSREETEVHVGALIASLRGRKGAAWKRMYSEQQAQMSKSGS